MRSLTSAQKLAIGYFWFVHSNARLTPVRIEICLGKSYNNYAGQFYLDLKVLLIFLVNRFPSAVFSDGIDKNNTRSSIGDFTHHELV
ncbi:hypothetical protein [Microseira sp. BLCC-F43]|uniref:hypothetical protein n=1 Tax=Microseira sp. BLCC-F43 TaxID=3153602 RepID=UPI0035B7F60A